MMNFSHHTLLEYFEVVPQIGNEYQARYQRFFIRLAMIAFIAATTYGTLALSTGAILTAYFNAICALFMVILLFFYKYTRRYTLSVTACITSLQLLVALDLLTLDTQLNGILTWSTIILIGTLLITGGRYALAYLGSVILIDLTAIFLNHQNLLQHPPFNKNMLLIFDSVSLFCSLFTALVLGLITVSSYDEIVYNIEKQKKKFYESCESNSALLSIMTHDIANPLTVILNYLDQLKHNKKLSLPSKDQEILRKITTNAQQIHWVIQSIRTIKANTDQKISIKLTAVNLVELLELQIKNFSNAIANKQLEIIRIFDETQIHPYWTLADPTSLQFSVINNLLSNAIKFSKPGSKICISVVPHQESLLFIIKDEGIGIPTAFLPYLFSTNKITLRNGTEGEKGCGFGLPLVKMFVEKYGGCIDIQSQEENTQSIPHGTTVKIYFKRITSNHLNQENK